MPDFVPPPLSSHEGPAAGFIPPSLDAHEGPARAESGGILPSFGRGLKTLSPAIGSGAVVTREGEQAALARIKSDPGGYLLDHVPFVSQIRKIADDLKAGRSGADVAAEALGQLIAGGIGAPPVPVGSVMQPAGRMKYGGMVPESPEAPSALHPAILKITKDLAAKKIIKIGESALGLPPGTVKTARVVVDLLREAIEQGKLADAPEPPPATSVRPGAVPPTAPAPSPIIQPDGLRTRPDAIPSQHGLLPPLDRSQFFRPLSREAESPAPVVAAASPAPIAAAAPAVVPVEAPAAPQSPRTPVLTRAANAPVEEAITTTADDELEAALQKSIEMVRARKGGVATGREPVVSAANQALNDRLIQESKESGANLEMKARTRKALKLGRFLQDGGISLEDLHFMTPEHWESVANAAGVKKPSAATIDTVKGLMAMGRD